MRRSFFISQFIAIFFLLNYHLVVAQPSTLQFADCFSGTNSSVKLNISTVYGQVITDDRLGTHLNLTVFGNSSQNIVGAASSTLPLSTLFTTTTVLTLNVYTTSTYLCNSLRPPSPLDALNSTVPTYCPLEAGPFALSAAIPWGDHRALTTLNTRLRAVDPYNTELFCLQVSTTPLSPRPRSPYGNAIIIFWCTVALVIAYWLIVGIARIASAWDRGITRPSRGLWSRVESAGFILASAISGERLGTSPALMRFGTPSMRDIMFHTQWCAALAMVAVEWPQFVYPLLTQTAWSTLSYNITVTENARNHHWNPLSVDPFNPPSGFSDQLSDTASPIFINTSAPNILFTLPDNTTSGIESFAYALGVRPKDLFGNCLIIFLAIIAATIALSFLVWLIDWIPTFIGRLASGTPNQISTSKLGTRSPRFSSASKDILDGVGTTNTTAEESKSLNGNNMFRPPSRFTLPLVSGNTTTTRSWWRMRPNISSFHGSVLHGNLVRILVLFHLPVTIFSCYQMTMSRSDASLSSIVLAALSFAVFSVILPVLLVLRVTMTTTNKLYDETRTLLSLGPLYNHYRHGSQMFASLLFATNLAFGITIGCGQKSGTAQAIIILVVEVVSALVTSVWLPWGQGASMGLISFLFCVARIVIAVLLVILTPTISVGAGPAGWVAYGILVILALVYLALVLMLIVKLIEAAVRIFGCIGFDRSSHVVDSGLLGACGLLGCCGPRKRRRHRSRSRRNRDHTQYHPTTGQPVRDVASEMSSYSPPNVLGDSSRKGSTHSGPPPSVLKPEHALRPYREDSDDENGFIMGAWQPFPRPGYTAVNNMPTSPLQQPPRPANTNANATPPGASTSGFSRVGGGRAHFETPYAITSGSTQTFPSIGHQSAVQAMFDDDDSPPPSLSSVARHQDGGLPPGAMQPSHVRTKSQTAIIEDASTFVMNDIGASSRNAAAVDSRNRQSQGLSNSQDAAGLLQPPTMLGGLNDDDSSDQSQPKKKPWYYLRKHRPQSSDGPPAPPADEEAPPAPTPPGRSFVVVRKPQGSPARSQNLSSGTPSPGVDLAATPTGTPSRGTFAVSRPSNSRAAS